MNHGKVEGIFVAAAASGPMHAVEACRAHAGRGLEGDRYCLSEGTFSGAKAAKQQITLIEAEAIDAAQREYGLDYHAIDARRNLLVRGVAVNHLIDREFSIGPVRLKGAELAEPCGHMEKLCGKKGAKKALIHRGGLRAEILTDGEIRVGDPVHW